VIHPDRRPFPEWAEYRRNSIWIYDVTHFAGCPKHAVFAVMDLVTRNWIGDLVSIEETSTQVQVVFMDALESEGLLELIEARQDAAPADTSPFDADVDVLPPVLLAVSDNGPQMTSGSTREFMAMCAIAQHFGRPGTPTDQAWIESLFSHVKAVRRCCSHESLEHSSRTIATSLWFSKLLRSDQWLRTLSNVQVPALVRRPRRSTWLRFPGASGAAEPDDTPAWAVVRDLSGLGS
jgi:transposase InsO family protein